MIKFIYFDVGGVFVDFHNFFKKVTSDFNIPLDIFMGQWQKYGDAITRGDITPQEFWNKVRKNLKIKKGQQYDFLESWISDYRCIQPMYDFAQELSQNYRLGIISNLYKGMFSELIKKQFLPDISYKTIVTSCDVGMKKPDRDIYEFAQKKAKVNSSEILLIDDREDFINGAVDCGWQAVQFKTFRPEVSIQEIKTLLKKS